jgi:hypothetical protein
MSGCGPARTAGVKSGWGGDPLLVCVVGGRMVGGRKNGPCSHPSGQRPPARDPGCASEKQVPRFARNDSQNGKGKCVGLATTVRSGPDNL